MFYCTHTRGLVFLAVAVALGGLVATPALAQCEHFYPATPIEVGDPNLPESVAMGDLDGDDDLDLAVSHYMFAGRLTVLFNAGDATFPERASYEAGDTPEFVAIGELDGQDGLDIVVVNYYSDFASVYLNDGSGGFTPTAVTTEVYAEGVAIGDLDGDGDEDLATAHSGGGDLDLVAVHWNNGDGTFTPGPVYPPTEEADLPLSVAIGDMDGVNGNDIVVGVYYPWCFIQYLNNGDGTFTAEQVNTGGSCNVCITVTDVDGDGDNDVGSALYWGPEGAFTMSLNNGDATYSTTTYWTGAWASTGIALGDLDGQPGPEALVVNREDLEGPPGMVSVQTNDGAGGFSNNCKYEVGDDPWGLAVGDLNGDSWNDAVTANYGSGNCSLLLNQGGISCPGDVDGDGDTDHADLGALLSAWDSVPGDPNWNPGADLDGNGHVHHSDLGILLSDWGCGT